MVEEIVLKAGKRARELVSRWPDFRIQRTSPYDPKFVMDGDVRHLYDELSLEYHGVPENDLMQKYVAAAFVDAMQRVKEERIRDRTWNPYNLPDPYRVPGGGTKGIDSGSAV